MGPHSVVGLCPICRILSYWSDPDPDFRPQLGSGFRILLILAQKFFIKAHLSIDS
jgi:hypothetical protein